MGKVVDKMKMGASFTTHHQAGGAFDEQRSAAVVSGSVVIGNSVAALLFWFVNLFRWSLAFPHTTKYSPITMKIAPIMLQTTHQKEILIFEFLTIWKIIHRFFSNWFLYWHFTFCFFVPIFIWVTHILKLKY